MKKVIDFNRLHKQEYMKPTINVAEIDIRSQILDGSGLRGGITDDLNAGLDFGGDTEDLTPSGDGNIWGD
ncbi:MAG: hypothetical protein K5854_03065 [Prevotella sp.]|nr:hypothetical protein [Prevotella sp.]